MLNTRLFWRQVLKLPGDCCWVWLGCRTDRGYGKYHSTAAQEQKAHRVAWFIHYGRRAASMLLHSCNNRACVRWNHLYEGNQKQNARDRDLAGRTARGRRNGRFIHGAYCKQEA